MVFKFNLSNTSKKSKGKESRDQKIDDENFQNEALSAHNEYRRKHSAPPLSWSNELACNAQKWASTIAKKGKLEHAKPDDRKNQGENIACASGQPLDGRKATTMWYDEVKDYDFQSKPTYNPKCGHFTQVIWASSKEVGLGKATSSNGMSFVVARYSPAGNNLSEFENNIKPPTDESDYPDLPRQSMQNYESTDHIETSKENEDFLTKDHKNSSEDHDENQRSKTYTICHPDFDANTKIILSKEPVREDQMKLKQGTPRTVNISTERTPLKTSHVSNNKYIEPGKTYQLIHYVQCR